MSCWAVRTAARRPRTDHDACLPCSVGMRGGVPGVPALALTAWLAGERGDAALADACGAHMRAVYGPPSDWSATVDLVRRAWPPPGRAGMGD